jgi:zinc transporter 9
VKNSKDADLLLIHRRSFLVGILPLSLSLTPSRLRLISTVGMGVLVGTSLIVIIPEGVETLYSAQSKSHTPMRHHPSGSSVIDARWPTGEAVGVRRRDSADTDAFLVPGPVIADKSDVAPATPTLPGVIGIMDDENSGNNKDVDGHNQGEEGPHDESHHAWMGIALISGFILMYLIDKLPAYMTAPKPHTQPYHISLSNLGRRFNPAAPAEEESDTFLDNRAEGQGRSRSFATTTGLVIHAAADGIALGASSSASNAGLSFIIFFAIMVHKAPAAFGLTSVLLKQGLSKRSVRSHLLLFSLAAPTGALFTWVATHALGVGNVESAEWWTGMLLLFSGGTFLYVAMHTMQESGPGHEPHLNGHANGSIDGRESLKAEQESSVKDLLAALFGMILPLFLQVGHAH